MIKKINDPQIFKKKALQWASSFNVFCCLDSNNFTGLYSKFDSLIAAGVKNELTATSGTAFEQLEKFRKKHKDWMTGFFGYDLKNEMENIISSNPDHLHFPDLYFFVPLHLVIINGNEIEIIADDAQLTFECIEKQALRNFEELVDVNVHSRISKSEYLAAVDKIKQHIRLGDIYVTNFCQEFYADNTVIDPLNVFLELNAISPNPFSAFFKLKDKHIICASPERFLAKRGDKLISQPIKGTAKRGKNEAEDEAIKNELRNQTKELQENVMIVDLVRNDLTRSAKGGTVKTEALFEIYTFSRLHQMISTVVCQLDERVSVVQAIKNTFPMGSMTGAPKISAMQFMEQYESSKRGVYSGAIGYFSPDNDFDFNVVIRSILYDCQSKYLSFHAGSAITWHANAEKEYEECLLKTKAILEVLGSKSITETRIKKPSDYAGILTKEEAEELIRDVKQSRNEWDRDIRDD